jgi:predicted N-acetyltransferase YhbS
VEYLIRPARITDVDRLVALAGGTVRASAGTIDSGDLLRQLVYLPQASIFIAEARRDVVGGAVLALRPSVRAGGFVGVVDFLVVDPDHDADRVTDALLEEVLRSARNKGCSLVEAPLPDDPAERTRLARHGFIESGPQAECRVAVVGATGARSGH